MSSKVSSMRVAVIGAGYVGLVTSVGLADIGHTVACVDIDHERVASLRRGDPVIHEEGLAPLMQKLAADGVLRFSLDLFESVREATIVFICVGTPPRASDGHADLSYVFTVAMQIADAARDGTTIVVKSTVPVGTCDEITALVRRINPSLVFSVVSNPEFLREGSALKDFREPDRIVIGTSDHVAAAVMRELYASFLNAGVPLVAANLRTSELIKYASNCFLALKVTFINEIANLCEHIDAEISDLSLGMGLDSRIGPKFLQPGPGFGGSCFPKDMLALVKTAQDNGVAIRSIETALAVNDVRKGEMVRKIIQAAGGSVDGKRLAILGLTFKANTDDMRAAVSLVIIPQLRRAGASIVAYDPVGMSNAKMLLPDVQYADDVMAAAKDADLLVVLTEWPEFRQLDLSVIARLVKQKILVDLRNIIPAEKAFAEGFHYVSIGHADRHQTVVQSDAWQSRVA